MSTADEQHLRALGERSIEIIATNQAPNGAYLASPSFPVYHYAWLRDGAFIADGMSRAGEIESAEAFFEWCSGVLLERKDHIESLITRHRVGDAIAIEEFLPARYTVDGADGTEPWTNFQLDGYGAWVWALVEHARRHRRPIASLDGALLSVRYAAAFWDVPSYDWWEEFVDHRHTSTLAAIYAGCQAPTSDDEIDAELRIELATTAAAIRGRLVEVAAPIGYLPKWLGTTAIDASLVSVGTPFNVMAPDHPLIEATIAEIERQLVHDGGVHRYADDTYYGGGEWLLLAGLLGWHYARVGRRDDARRSLAWIASHATSNGEMPEQVTEHLLAPIAHDGWVRRWGPIATPLLWSHAMYLTLAIELGIMPAGAAR
jgi:GH15 family glucan-1,4-alpha-glucosidase